MIFDAWIYPAKDTTRDSLALGVVLLALRFPKRSAKTGVQLKRYFYVAHQMEVDNLFGVKGKVVLVTGGGRGIGFMISKGFVRNGATVYIASRSKKVSSRSFLFLFLFFLLISKLSNYLIFLVLCVQECNKAAEELTAAGPGKCVALSSANISTVGACVRPCGASCC